MRRKVCWRGLNGTTHGDADETCRHCGTINDAIWANDMSVPLSIIIPVLNEAANIAALLATLAPLRERGAEIIVVDGGSIDATSQLAIPLANRVIPSERGRARQMNAGAAQASGEVLLFLHADTLLPANADQLILQNLYPVCDFHWGRFDVRIAGQPAMLAIIGHMINWRSRTFGIATGDQAIFIRRTLFERLGGFPQQALMEDIELCKRLNRHSSPLCLQEKATTSGRRWEKSGVWATILLMWRLRFLYWIGVPGDQLAKEYR